MQTVKLKINGEQSQVLSHAPVLLWLLLVILPALAGKFIFASAIDMETQLEKSRLRQKFNIELQKYQTALEPGQWLRDRLFASSYNDFTNKLMAGTATIDDYRQNPFMKGISTFEESPGEEIEIFSRHFFAYAGSRPDFVFVMAQNEDDCGWQIHAPFAQPDNKEEFRTCLKKSWQILSERIYPPRDRSSEKHRNFSSIPVFSKIAGIFDFLATNFDIGKSHFSTHNNTGLFVSLLPVPDKNGNFNHRFVIAGISLASIKARFMLQTTCKQLSGSVIRHSFGTCSEKNLPVFVEENDRLSLIGATPESFQKLAWGHISAGGKPLAIRISESRALAEGRKKARFADTILLIYALSVSLLMVGIKSGRFKKLQKIRMYVGIGLFSGMLLPLGGTVWLGVCYMNTSRHLEAEQTIDLMQNAIHVKDQAIKLQLARNVLFRNILANIFSLMKLEKLANIGNTLGLFAREGQSETGLPVYKRIRHLIDTFIIYHPELDYLIGMSNNRKKITETPHLFFGSHALEVLFQLGAMRHMSAEKQRRISDKNQYTLGFLENVIDPKVVSRVFAEEKSAVRNSMSSRRENLTVSIWKTPTNHATGLSIFQTDSSCWFYDFAEMLEKGLVKQELSFNGYRVFLNFYLRHSYNFRVLSDHTIRRDIPSKLSDTGIRPLADALFTFSNINRINNLDSADPHLIFTAPAADGDVWIMGIARPETSSSFIIGNAAIIFFALLALICAVVLARGLSRVLLRPLPAFEAAINELSKENFHFSMQIDNGDEFDMLGNSFNKISRKLYEKSQISQLVSRNVLDAISSSHTEMLKPGGSRVEASILFADLRNFTTISEKYPPEEIVDMLNEYFSVMTEIIESHGGVVDKLIGDAIQAVFYAHENTNCAASAVDAALKMREALINFNSQRRQQQLFTIENGAGICTGSVICGRVGSNEGMLDATIVGSLVSRAAQLESLSKHCNGSRILLDKATQELLPEGIYSFTIPAIETAGSPPLEVSRRADSPT